MAHNSEPREVVEVVFPGGTVGRTTRAHAQRAGLPLVEELAAKAEVAEPRKRGRRPAVTSVEADETND